MKALAFCVVILAIGFFLLRDEIEQVKRGFVALDSLNTKVDELNKQLENFKIRFNTLEEDNQKFQESTARFIQGVTSELRNK